jgi:DNA-binding transcriptional regulator LsrR (DeoR family)
MQERISMIKLQEILRLRYEKGLSVRAIGVSCNVSRQTVANYIALAKINGIDWEVDKNLSDTELELKLFKGKKKEVNNNDRNKKLVPDYEYINRELKKQE